MRKLMNKFICILFVACFMFSLSGCSKSGETEYTVYYSNSTRTRLQGKTYKVSETDQNEIITDLLHEMDVYQKQDDLSIIKPDSVSIESTKVESGTAYIYYSSEYNEMTSTNELLYRSAVVRTLTQIDGVDYVRFFIDGSPAQYQDGSYIGLMSASDFVDDSSENIGDVQWVDLKLYYSNKLGDKLVETTTSVAYNKNISLEKMVVETLINGPMNTAYNATLPSDLKLLSISLKNGVCYVNLSSSFLTEMVNVSNEIPIYSIVNSLCDLDSVDSVRILINGDSNTTFRETISLDNTFTFNSDLIEN